MEIVLDGEGSRGRVISRSVAKNTSHQTFYPKMVGNAACFGHVQCDSIIMDEAHIQSIPAIVANCTEAQLIHEAAIGKMCIRDRAPVHHGLLILRVKIPSASDAPDNGDVYKRQGRSCSGWCR